MVSIRGGRRTESKGHGPALPACRFINERLIFVFEIIIKQSRVVIIVALFEVHNHLSSIVMKSKIVAIIKKKGMRY